MATQTHGGRTVIRLPTARPLGDLPVEVLESKLYQPAIRRGVVPRPELLARLRAARAVPTVAVVAPAGYGKTTLLALWAEADDRPFAWVSLDPHDNDPIVLLTHLAVAIDRDQPAARRRSSTPCVRPGSRYRRRSFPAWDAALLPAAAPARSRRGRRAPPSGRRRRWTRW